MFTVRETKLFEIMKEKISNNLGIPMLHESSLDYPTVTHESVVIPNELGDEKISLMVKQSISDSNLIAQMLLNGQAKFAVEISSPYTIYRKIVKCEHKNGLSSEQVVDLCEELVEPPVYLRPLIIAELNSPLSIQLDKVHAVHKSWYGNKINILPGSILVRGQFWLPTSTMQSLVRIAKDEKGDLSPGTYEVSDCNSDGFYFKVTMHPNLFEVFLNPGSYEQRDHCNSILSGALSTGFEILRREPEYQPDDESGAGLPPVLHILYKKMVREGIETWDSDNFRSELAATSLRPIALEKRSYDND